MIYNRIENKPTHTISGKAVYVFANVGSLDDAESAERQGADGVGVVRSEILFESFDKMPDTAAQLEYYNKIIESVNGKPVSIRTFDRLCGGLTDCISYLRENNPALGMRGVRYSLYCPECFEGQLSAILQASVSGQVAVIFPMVSCESEIFEAVRIFDAVKSEFDSWGIAYSNDVRVGIMIETPASAILSKRLAKYVDFFSIGTNDLCRFTYAADSDRIIPDYPEAVLELVRIAAESICKYNDKKISLSGDMAADTRFTQMFIDMGIDAFSVSPNNIGKLKERIAECR